MKLAHRQPDNFVQVALILLAAAIGSVLVLVVRQPYLLGLLAMLLIATPLLSGMALFKSLSFWGRIILLLFLFRPLIDLTASEQSGVTPQNIFAGVLMVCLCLSWLLERPSGSNLGVPNILLWGLILTGAIAWLSGGIGEGFSAFSRTVWVWILALTVGNLFGTEARVRIFVRAVFLSSSFFLLIVTANLGSGYYAGEFWRLGGQYAVPNTLASLALVFFMYGLFAFDDFRLRKARVAGLGLLLLLGTVVVLAQSKTASFLLFVITLFWLWTQGRRKLFYAVGTVVLLVSLFASGLLTEWRGFGILTGERGAREELLVLTGRTVVWAAHIEAYSQANLFRKVMGLGWGRVLSHFEQLGIEESSVTENSFLWLLVGGGMISLLLFVAYLIWVVRQAFTRWRTWTRPFDRRLALFCFAIAISFTLESVTMDLLLSPLISGYHMAIMSAFVTYSRSWQQGHEQATARVAKSTG